MIKNMKQTAVINMKKLVKVSKMRFFIKFITAACLFLDCSLVRYVVVHVMLPYVK